MTLQELREHAANAKKAAENISNATPDEITALFLCPDLLLAALEKLETTKEELINLISE